MAPEPIRELSDQRRRLWKALGSLVTHLDHHNALIAASAMAFDAFLSLVPLLAFVGLVLAWLHQTGELVLRPVLDAIPRPARQLVLDALGDGAGAGTLAPFSLLAFVWVSSGGLSTAMFVFESAYHSRPRPFWLRRIIAMACAVGSVAVIAVVTVATWYLTTLLGSMGARVVAVTVPSLTIVGLLIAFFRIAIRGPRPRRRRTLPGVLVTVLLWSILSAAFSYYVSHLGRYTTLYGGLAAVAIFLFWLWLLALSLLVGGEVNAQLDGIREDMPIGAAETPLPWLKAPPR